MATMRMAMMRAATMGLIGAFGLMVASFPSLAQAPQPADATFPGQEFLLSSAAAHIRNGDVRPIWLADGNFAYRRQTEVGTAWVVVDATAGARTAAFDHAQVARALSVATGTKISADALPFPSFDFTAGRRAIRVLVGDGVYHCALDPVGACTQEFKTSVDGQPGVISPDRRWIAYRKAYDLRVRSTDGTIDFALTDDGSEDAGYAGSTGNDTSAITRRLRGIPSAPQVIWSPDSRHILSHFIDERQVGEQVLLQSAPGDGSVRAKAWRWRYSYPGEAKAMQRLLIFDIVNKARVAVGTAAMPLPFTSTIAQFAAWWSSDGSHVYFVDRGPHYRSVSLQEADATTGVARTVIEESAKNYLELGGIGLPPMVRVTRSGDLIWYSRADGYAHLYRYDLKSGRLRNQITSGPWMVRDIVRVDEARGRIIFTASGRDGTRDPYFRKLYSVGLDGRGLTLLTPEDAEHAPYASSAFMPNPLGIGTRADAVSPGGDRIVETYSRADMPPVSVLRAIDGRIIAKLEQASLVGLALSADALPEPFEALAADGKTRLNGTLYRPVGFDPRRRYPLVDSIYAAPQTRRALKSYVDTLFDRGGAMAMAQRGMIVFTLDARGTPDRSQAFLLHAYGRLDNPGLDDHVAVIQQLTARFPYIDPDRVGIYGVSGGGYATARAMFTYPDIFKAGVANAGNHDQRGYIAVWAETYNGPDDGQSYLAASNARLAANLKGKLMLIHGEMDDNVHPAHTMQVVDALIKADKDFDLLIVPGANHSVYNTPYVWRRTGDFLARALIAGPVAPRSATAR